MTVEDIELTLQKGLGLKGAVHLLSVMGSARAVYESTEEELICRAGLRPELARSVKARTSRREAESEMKYLRKQGIEAVASTDPGYPSLLRECQDYPHVLYYTGDAAAFRGRLLAGVGTRAATAYGQRMCERLVGRLAELCPEAVVVSGLAYGIDAALHRAALQAGIATIGVVATPLPEVSPSQHRQLAKEMAAKGGAVVTELHSQCRRNGAFFIPRNRIIAGMAEGTVVVESPSKGGSLSTAAFADGYGRTVMAVPGRVGDRCSEGTNRLIAGRVASAVCSAEDILHELGWDISVPGHIPLHAGERPVLGADEKLIAQQLADGSPRHFDALALSTGIPAGELAALLLEMELGGIVRSLPGKMYELA